MPRKQWSSLLFGAFASILLVGVPALLLGTVFPPSFFLTILVVAFFWSGVVHVPTGYYGVLKRLQRRLGLDIIEGVWEVDILTLKKSTGEDLTEDEIRTLNAELRHTVLGEGWYWIIPFIESTDLVDIKLRTTEAKQKLGDGDPPHILCVDGTVQPKITYQWRIFGTPLGVTQILVIDPSTVLEGVNDAIISTFGAMAAQKTTLDVRTKFRTKGVKKRLLEAIDERTSQWFVHVEMPNIVDISLDPKVEEAINRRAVESEEKIAETTQTDLLVTQAKRLVEESKDADGKPTMTLDEAMRRLQIDREKPGTREIAITGDIARAVTGIASAIRSGKNGGE